MFSQMKLGISEFKKDDRTLRLAKYLRAAQLPSPPASADWYKKVSQWPMMLNDKIGCCAISAPGHMDQLWSTADGATPVVPSDDQILAEYSAVSGYDPKTGANDNGCAMLDVMNRWRQVGLFGKKIDAYAGLQLQNHAEVAFSIWGLGGINAGVQLPLAWQNSTVWDVPRHRLRFWQHYEWQPGSWGGHDVPILGYDQQYLYAVSWGRVINVTWAAWDAYFVQALVALSNLWTGADGVAPSKLDVAALQADLAAIGAN